jgi:hypothetical protein
LEGRFTADKNSEVEEDNVSYSLLNKIKPKTLKRSYKRHAYVVTYIPKEKKWKWSVTVTTSMTYEDKADTQVKAFRAAEKFIDENCK